MGSSFLRPGRSIRPAGQDHTTGETTDEPSAAGSGSRAIRMAIVMAGLLLALVLLLTGLFVWQGQRDARAGVEARASTAAFTASSYARWLIEANLQASRRVADAIARRPNYFDAPEAGILEEVSASIPEGSAVALFGADGKPVLAGDGSPGVADIAGKEAFAAVRSGTEWVIAPFIRQPRGDGELIPILRRIERDGQFLGAVAIYVPVRMLALFWQSLDTGPGSSVGLLREDGWLIARYPIPDKPINLANYVLFTHYLPAAPAGVYGQETSPADGLARIVGYRKVEGLPLVTVVGVPVTVLDGDVWRRAWEIAVVALPIWLALLVLTLFTVRLLHREERAHAALAGALERNRILLREIHHRVKNNLQTVTSLIQLQPGQSTAKAELMNRIAAMTAVHEHIYRSDRFDHVDIAEYIRTLVAQLQESYGPAVRVDCSLASVMVSSDQALPVGLIVNEVITNAFKHAFPDGRAGVIAVTIGSPRPGEVQLTVRDNGVGFGTGRAGGMGTRLIRGLSRQVRGRYEFRNDHGTLFTLDFSASGEPLDPLHEARPAAVA